MTKTYLYSFIILSFCSTLFDFMLGNEIIVYPRDRIIHIMISAAITFIIIYMTENINFNKGLVRIIASIAIILRMGYLMYGFINYFSTFHGANTEGILIFSAVTFLLVLGLTNKKTEQLYSFFILINILMAVLYMVLSIDKINVINLYSNNTGFVLSAEKLYLFFDILTLATVAENKQDRIYTQKRYLYISALVFVGFTLLQGLTVQGNMLYSLSPLQSLAQVFTGITIKKYDYIITLFHTINFFAAVTLYAWSLKKLWCKEGQGEQN